MIQRLDFKLDEFVRTSFVSTKAREKWNPIFHDLSRKFSLIERGTVAKKLRKIALQHTGDIVTLTKEAMRDGLSVIPLEKVNVSSHYQSAHQPFDPNKPHEYKVAIGCSSDVSKFAVAYASSDNAAIGDMLGYPLCCQAFFKKYWVEENWIDTTWPMVNSERQTEALNDVDPRNNILLRWLGLRPVSHLPCSFDCENTRLVADLYKKSAQILGICKDWNQLMDILSWPIEWNSLHGIAQIITPIMKITTSTDALAQKRTVRLVNNKIPEESGSGIEFPFISDTWTANGFLTYDGMKKGHDQIISTLTHYNPRSVLDLGSGNGELLRRIHREFGADTWGVDMDYKKLPDLVSNIYDFDFDQTGGKEFDVALIAAQRYIEEPGKCARLEERIAKNVRHLMIYDYTNGGINIKSYGKAKTAP